MTKYICLITYKNNRGYYALYEYKKQTEKRMKFLYDFLKAFSKNKTECILIRQKNRTQAVNELNNILNYKLNGVLFSRKQLPKFETEFIDWIIKEE